LKDYEISSAIPKLLNIITEKYYDRKKYTYKIFTDKTFLKFYATYRIKIIIDFIIQKKIKFVSEEIRILFKYKKINLLRAMKYIYRGIKNIFK
ncbi:hypothetical protein KA977_10665, partial [Candidatus Dependentiae bacterium]|nr:hypothetical protein [Candidatus Dependentiae bacterium]